MSYLSRPPLVDEFFGSTLVWGDRLDCQFNLHPDDEVILRAVDDLRQDLGTRRQFDLSEDVRNISGPAGGRDTDDGIAVQRSKPSQVHRFHLERGAGLAESRWAEDGYATVVAANPDQRALASGLVGDLQSSRVN